MAPSHGPVRGRVCVMWFEEGRRAACAMASSVPSLTHCARACPAWGGLACTLRQALLSMCTGRWRGIIVCGWECGDDNNGKCGPAVCGASVLTRAPVPFSLLCRAPVVAVLVCLLALCGATLRLCVWHVGATFSLDCGGWLTSWERQDRRAKGTRRRTSNAHTPLTIASPMSPAATRSSGAGVRTLARR